MEYSSYHVNVPQWREITVGSHLPAELRRFAEMAHNLWWTWNEDAKSLYSGLNRNYGKRRNRIRYCFWNGWIMKSWRH